MLHFTGSTKPGKAALSLALLCAVATAVLETSTRGCRYGLNIEM